MPSINMITARRAEKLRYEKLTKIMLLVIICLLVITVLMFSFMAARLFNADRNVAHLDRQLKKVQPTVDKIRDYEDKIKLLEPRLELLQDSRKQTLSWHTIFQDLSRSMPQQTWLRGLTTSRPNVVASGDKQPPPKITLDLRGVSTSQMLVGETMLGLNRFTEFEKTELTYTQEGADPELPTVEFQIAVQLKSDEQKGGKSTNASN
jgi:Tfp pilus assembly protein PilN